MNWKTRTSGALLGLAVLAGGIAIGQDWGRHPNLGAADQAVHQALDALHAAQRANHYDLAGHAAHAEQLLRQADREIRASAAASR